MAALMGPQTKNGHVAMAPRRPQKISFCRRVWKAPTAALGWDAERQRTAGRYPKPDRQQTAPTLPVRNVLLGHAARVRGSPFNVPVRGNRRTAAALLCRSPQSSSQRIYKLLGMRREKQSFEFALLVELPTAGRSMKALCSNPCFNANGRKRGYRVMDNVRHFRP